jgi:hypothetical protein
VVALYRASRPPPSSTLRPALKHRHPAYMRVDTCDNSLDPQLVGRRVELRGSVVEAKPAVTARQHPQHGKPAMKKTVSEPRLTL